MTSPTSNSPDRSPAASPRTGAARPPRSAPQPPVPQPQRTDGFGPQDHGFYELDLNGIPLTLDLPADGRKIAGWASRGHWPELFPGCLTDLNRDYLLYRLGDRHDPLGLRACWQVVQEIAPDIYGVPWWSAVRLGATAAAEWTTYSAWCVKEGFNPGIEPAHRIMSSIWAWMLASASDEKDMRKMQMRIFEAPKPQSKKHMKQVPGFRPEDQAALFAQAMATLGDG